MHHPKKIKLNSNSKKLLAQLALLLSLPISISVAHAETSIIQTGMIQNSTSNLNTNINTNILNTNTNSNIQNAQNIQKNPITINTTSTNTTSTNTTSINTPQNMAIKKTNFVEWQKISPQAPFNQSAFSFGETSELNIANAKKNQADVLITNNNQISPNNPPHTLAFNQDGDLWYRIRQGFAIPKLQTDLVQNRRDWYLAQPAYFTRITERANKYLYHIVEEVAKRKMPMELALLPIVESAFNPTANSSAKAAGIWQFMPKTGQYFNLQQSAFIDERRDVLQSTNAALDYLQKLHGMFGDWHLALAAYNWGEGSVMRAIAKNKAQGLPLDYLSLNMPQETRYYVPKLMAVREIIENAASYQVKLPAIANHPYFLSVKIKEDIDVSEILRLAGLSMQDFLMLNPGYKKPVIAAASSPEILLPWEGAQIFEKALASSREKNISLSSYTAIKLDKRERVESIAERFNTTPEYIRQLNKIGKGMRFVAGSIVLVPKLIKDAIQNISENIVNSGQVKSEKDVPDTRRVQVLAGRFDALHKIAERYQVSLGQLFDWNPALKNGLRPSQALSLVLPYQASFNINPRPPMDVMIDPNPKPKPKINVKSKQKINNKINISENNIEEKLNLSKSVKSEKSEKSLKSVKNIKENIKENKIIKADKNDKNNKEEKLNKEAKKNKQGKDGKDGKEDKEIKVVNQKKNKNDKNDKNDKKDS